MPNKQAQAIFLSHNFHSMTQGDSSIAEYCQHMKTLADALRDVGHPVQDSQLVLNLLHGLNPRYSNTADDIANFTVSFPSFTQPRDMLALKEFASPTRRSNGGAFNQNKGGDDKKKWNGKGRGGRFQQPAYGGQQTG
ncbi:uncharacterized protein LOC105913954 [Setaria italica]|uniref:uncharacterized protein LOC105913954 n=1 Tax=Setaria italica TaxID=4555 RepID=UPI0006475EFA|nr:uncharacterized protein LOC105913954 [Setaria italica]